MSVSQVGNGHPDRQAAIIFAPMQRPLALVFESAG